MKMIELSKVKKVLDTKFVASLRLARDLSRDKRVRFQKRLHALIADYIESKRSPTPEMLSAELERVQHFCGRALRLKSRKVPRPKNFRRALEQTSQALAGLSQPARELLFELPSDPIEQKTEAEQIKALLSLYGSVTRRVAPRRTGRPTLAMEKRLYSSLCILFIQTTGGTPSLDNSAFIELCETTTKRCQLHEFKWKSMERASRRLDQEFSDLEQNPEPP